METSGVFASILISFVSALFFAYLLHWFDRYEKEPFLLLAGVFLWGAVVAAGGAFIINTVMGLGIFAVTGSEAASNLVTTSLTAPFIEEILKGFAVLMVFFAFRDQFDSLLDGILYAGVAALGFAATENAYYIYAYGFAESGWQGFWQLAQIRILLVGWQHPFYTAFFGIGLATSRLNRSLFVKIIAPVIGLAAAIFAHSLHNTLASFLPGAGLISLSILLDWLGWAAMLIFILIAMALEKTRDQNLSNGRGLPRHPDRSPISNRHLCHTGQPSKGQSLLQRPLSFGQPLLSDCVPFGYQEETAGPGGR